MKTFLWKLSLLVHNKLPLLSMSKIPVLKASEVIRLLEKRGFVQVRQRDSHKQFCHEDGRSTTVPFHKGRDISPTLLRVIKI